MNLKDKIDLLETIRNEIKKTVNGKIDDIKAHLENQDDVLNEIRDEQARVKIELSRLKIETDPIIDGKKAISGLGKFIMWMGGIILIVAGVLKLVK